MGVMSVLERSALPKRYLCELAPHLPYSLTSIHQPTPCFIFNRKDTASSCHGAMKRFQKVPLKQHFLSDCCSTKSKGYARSATFPSQQYQQQQQQQKLEQTVQTQLLAGCQPKHSCLLYTQTEFARMFAPFPECQNRCFPVIMLKICSPNKVINILLL